MRILAVFIDERTRAKSSFFYKIKNGNTWLLNVIILYRRCSLNIRSILRFILYISVSCYNKLKFDLCKLTRIDGYFAHLTIMTIQNCVAKIVIISVSCIRKGKFFEIIPISS